MNIWSMVDLWWWLAHPMGSFVLRRGQRTLKFKSPWLLTAYHLEQLRRQTIMARNLSKPYAQPNLVSRKQSCTLYAFVSKLASSSIPFSRDHEEAAYQLGYNKTKIALATMLTTVRSFILCIYYLKVTQGRCDHF